VRPVIVQLTCAIVLQVPFEGTPLFTMTWYD
jgi:hypothetical protein